MICIGIRILDRIDNFVSVKLPEILNEVPDGGSFQWAILYLEAVGSLGENQSMPLFEDKIKQSKHGVIIDWKELNNLSEKFWDIVDITIIGCKNPSLIQRFEDDKKMYETCDFVIEMIDSGYWEVYSKNTEWINKLAKKFKEVEFLKS